MSHFLEILNTEINTFWCFKVLNGQPHCCDSLTDKGVETKMVLCRKQEGRRKEHGAGTRVGQTVWAMKVLATVAGFLVSFALAGDDGDRSNLP